MAVMDGQGWIMEPGVLGCGEFHKIIVNTLYRFVK